MRDFYPALEPYVTGFLQVSPLHTLYYEECGRPDGIAVVFLHGGPGGGLEPFHRQFFDPQRFRIVLFEQRGCGRSTPHSELRDNTTWDLVEDIEKLRRHLGIKQWLVFGGSWGSTLALAYGQTYPESCLGFVLRGIFMIRDAEIQWFYQKGTSELFPDLFEEYIKPIPPEERHDLVKAFYKRLTSDDPRVRSEAAKAWSIWEGSTSRLIPDPKLSEHFGEDNFADAFARIECHYFVHRGFFQRDDHLLAHMDRIRHLPCTIVQGRYDVVCPPVSAWDLHRAWPGSRLVWVPDAGHAASEPGTRSALIEATDAFAKKLI